MYGFLVITVVQTFHSFLKNRIFHTNVLAMEIILLLVTLTDIFLKSSLAGTFNMIELQSTYCTKNLYECIEICKVLHDVSTKRLFQCKSYFVIS